MFNLLRFSVLALIISATAQAQYVEPHANKAIAVLQHQYLMIGEATGHDLTGNHLKTEAKRILKKIQERPEQEIKLIEGFCSMLVVPRVVEPADEALLLAKGQSAIENLILSEDYRVMVAYPATLCGVEVDLNGLPDKVQKDILSVKGNFNQYFSAVQKETYMNRIFGYVQAMMKVANSL